MNKRFLGYQKCPSCDFMFLPEDVDQATCKLCTVAIRTQGGVAIIRRSTPLRPQCMQCRKEFAPNVKHRRYCSDECARKADNARNAIYYRSQKKAGAA